MFTGDTVLKVITQHVQAVPVRPSDRTALPIPATLDALVLACLAKDPRHRPQDAAAVLEMLAHCRSSEPWDSEVARNWWERHLVELSGPLAVSDALPLEPSFAIH